MRRFGRAGGFTLIEIMVVMVIVAIMASITIANMPRFARTGGFDAEARRLATLVDLAREEATLQMREFGLAVGPVDYAFFIFNDQSGAWEEITERPFQPRELPEGMTLDLAVEDRSLSLTSRDEDDDTEEKAPPILLLSSGETTPFELTLSMPAENLHRTLVADGYSGIVWASDEAETFESE